MSHPTLQLDDTPKAIPQKYVDLIDLEENKFQTMPIREVLRPNYQVFRFIAQVKRKGYLATPRSRGMEDEADVVIAYLSAEK